VYYGSRFYDPLLSRWASPDPIIPGVGEGGNPNAIGYLGISTYTPLIVDIHETQFLDQVNRENSARLQDPNFKLSPIPTNSIAFDRYAYSLNNPLRYVDPSGHIAILAALALISPVVWAAIGVTAVGFVLYFAIPDIREAVTAGIYQGGEAVLNGINALLAKKSDVAFVDYLQKKYGLTDAQRRALHDAITRQGLTNKEIEAEAAEMARLNQEKQKENQKKGK